MDIQADELFNTFEADKKKQHCAACWDLLEEPFICCAECSDLRLCIPCFARGTNVGEHLSSHCYTVFTDRMSVFENGWQIKEERKLLNLILECGYGNWEDIGRLLNRQAAECKHHYDTFYLNGPTASNLRDCGLPVYPFIPTQLPPYNLKVGCINPPRLHSTVPGYNALRSEFDSDHDHNEPEKDMAVLDVNLWDGTLDDSEFYQALQVAMAEVYTNRQKERARRRKIIRNHGLIMPHKTFSSMTRYISTLGRPAVENIAPFAQLLTGPQYDYLLEGLHLAQELCDKQRRLCELRSLGLRSHNGAKLMQHLAQMRAKHQRETKCSLLPSLGRGRVDTGTRGGSVRKPAPPLEVSGLPMCELLSPQEKELCATVRLVPENFIEFKNLLHSECKKANGLRLAQARKCIKIDVNKTRKLFDYLMEQGIIFPPLSVD